MKRTRIAAVALALLLIAMLVPSPALTWSADGFPFFTPYGQFVALAAGLAVMMLHVSRRDALRRGADPDALRAIERVDTPSLALACLTAGFVGARALYVLFRLDYYLFDVGAGAILRTWEGGFMLYGAALGALAAAAALAWARGARVAAVLDELAAPGLLMVSICRMAEGATTAEGVGTWVDSPLWQRFPVAVLNEYGEWQLAVFLYEALAAAAALFVVLRLRARRGERILTAALLYGACQIVLESLRMDSCLRIGFVRVSMVLSALLVLGVTLLRAGRAGRRCMAARGGLCLLLIAAAGGLEWALDKTPVSNPLLYALMAACCALMALLARGPKPVDAP